MADKQFKPGDHVKWGTPQGETQGVVVKKEAGEARVKGHVAHASNDHPEYWVKSDKSGKEAIHKPEALKKG